MENSARDTGSAPAESRRIIRTRTLRGDLVSVPSHAPDGEERKALLTGEGEEFLLEGGAADRLARHLGDKVIAWGSVSRNDDGDQILRVRGFEVVHWEEPSFHDGR